MVVLALTRGGAPVGSRVARELAVGFDVITVRKLGAPFAPELAMGAIATGGIRILNHEVISSFGISDATIEAVTAAEQVELERRDVLYRGNNPPRDLTGKTVLLVDDGLATGSTMLAAIAAVRARGAASCVVAVPVGARQTCEMVARHADGLVCLAQPADFAAVGEWYRDFSQVGDEEVRRLLEAPQPSA